MINNLYSAFVAFKADLVSKKVFFRFFSSAFCLHAAMLYFLLLFFETSVSCLSIICFFGFLIAVFRISEMFVLGGYDAVAIPELVNSPENSVFNITRQYMSSRLIHYITLLPILYSLLTLFGYSIYVFISIAISAFHPVIFPSFYFYSRNKVNNLLICVFLARLSLSLISQSHIVQSFDISVVIILLIGTQFISLLFHDVYSLLSIA